MKVYFNARFLTQPQSGVQRYALELLSALDAHWATQGGPRAIALVPSDPHPRHQPNWAHIRLAPVRGAAGHLWEQRALTRAASDGVLVSLCNSGPLVHPAQIVAFHDAHIFDHPEAFTARYRLWHSALRPRLARRARRVITVSPHAAARLGHHLNLPPEQFQIVPNAASHILRNTPDVAFPARIGLRRGGYFLTVGNNSPLKNLHRLIAAHATLPDGGPPLVIAGETPNALRGARVHIAADVHWLGRISDSQLAALYAQALAFVFPSQDEGFGIPPLEAAALGAPIVAANAGALPWVLGDAPIWHDPLDGGDMARALSAAMALTPAERAAHIAAGKKRAAVFSWSDSAMRLLTMIEDVLAQGHFRAA